MLNTHIKKKSAQLPVPILEWTGQVRPCELLEEVMSQWQEILQADWVEPWQQMHLLLTAELQPLTQLDENGQPFHFMFWGVGNQGFTSSHETIKYNSSKRETTGHYLSVANSEPRGLQQLGRGSWESSQAVRVLHSWPEKLQLELQGCHTSEAAVSRCQQLKRHPSWLPGSLCWHGLTALWQGHVDALEVRSTTI